MSILGIILNSLLFVAKMIIGIMSGSLALLSDAYNSLTDIVSSVLIFVAVRISQKKPDHNHPFGYHRAEPLVGVIVAIFAGILGFEVLKSAIYNIMSPNPITKGGWAISVLLISVVVKLFMATYFTKKGDGLNSPAIKASGIDSRNDVFVSVVAIIGVLCSIYKLPIWDSIAAIVISFFIFYSAYELGIKNIDYLMGKAPSDKVVKRIEKKALETKGVKGINDVFAHYVGNFIHIEIHIEVDKNLPLKKAHDIGKKVQLAIETMKNVDRAFIHIDPK